MTRNSDGGRADLLRSVALLLVSVLQLAAGVVGGAGLWGESVGVVANSYETVLLPASAAFTIWSLIYVLFGALAVRQVLPAQRGRQVHRRVGWWLVAAGALNATWVALFAHRQVVAAQVVIVVLLVCLGVAALRLRAPAQGWGDRLLLHLPVTLYLGWVMVASVVGAASTAASFDAAPSADAAVTALVLTGAAVAVAILRLPAVLGFAGAVCWALAWIAARTPVMSVRTVALVVAVAVVVVVALRLRRTAGRSNAAWG